MITTWPTPALRDLTNPALAGYDSWRDVPWEISLACVNEVMYAAPIPRNKQNHVIVFVKESWLAKESTNPVPDHT